MQQAAPQTLGQAQQLPASSSPAILKVNKGDALRQRDLLALGLVPVETPSGVVLNATRILARTYPRLMAVAEAVTATGLTRCRGSDGRSLERCGVLSVPCLAMVVNWFWDRSERQIFAEKPKRS